MAFSTEGARLLVMDVDGTLTDGRVYMGPDGEVTKAFDVKDGMGISRILPELEIEPAIITGRRSAILERRCEELGIREVHQGVEDKLAVLQGLVRGRGAGLEAVAYIGDDINDLACIQAVREAGGLAGCPADAVREVKIAVNFVSDKAGGRGAVRDFIEWLRALREISLHAAD